MSGTSDYASNALLNWVTGQKAMPALPAVWLALFTAVGVDAGTGFTEVSGAGYARAQVAGTAATNGTTAAGNPTLHFASVPSWIFNGTACVAIGAAIYDVTGASLIPAGTTILNATATTVTMSANAAGAGVGNGDTIAFSAFAAPSGSAPSTVTNGAIIGLAQATADWTASGASPVIAFGFFDALSSGNLLAWDFLGNFAWLPASVSAVGSGNGGVFTSHAHGFANGDPVVVSAETGGALPTVTQGSLAAAGAPVVNYAANVTTDTFTLSSSATAPSSGNAVWTSATGDVMVRKLTRQQIPANITMSFAASTLTLSQA